MTKIVSLGSLIGAIFLVAGTCVGGGMLALPVETASIGFFPSLSIMVVCWIFMTLTGLLLVEANLWMEEGAHMMTMSSRLLGFSGKMVSTVLYIFMGYGSLVAYTSAGGMILSSVFERLGWALSRGEACLVFSVLFGALLYFGTKLIGRINGVLVLGMIVAYLGLIFLGLPEVKSTLVLRRSWDGSLFSTPLILTTFSFQMIVPSLTPYLKRDPHALRKAIIFGTAIPFLAYALWQLVILGTIPFDGDSGLQQAFILGQAATDSLRKYVGSPWLSQCAEFFAFFALVTSYLGIALGLFDFLGDALSSLKKKQSKVSLSLLVIIPSFICAVLYPRAFLVFLEVTGGFGDTILNGILPVMMVWTGRYIKRIEGPYTLVGGKPLMLAISAFALLVFVLQIIKLA